MSAPLIAGPWYVGWKYVEREGDKKKFPFDAPGHLADVWTDGPYLTVERATELAASDGFVGIGVVFSARHQLVGVDLDGCRDPATGALTDWAHQIVGQLAAEPVPTPSGTGVRLWVLAPKDPKGPRKRKWTQPEWQAPPGVTKQPGVEVFLTGGFCTITGTPPAPPERPAELAALLATAPAPAAQVRGEPVPPRNADLALDELERLIETGHPKRYHKLFIAGAEERDDDSALDNELAGYCAEVAGGDALRIDALMRRSAIARDGTGPGDNKWRNHKTYLPRTIAHAIATLRALPDATLAPDPGPLDLTGAELARDPDLIKAPPSLTPWLAWRGELVMLVGREKLAGKSTLAASDAAGALRAGLTVLWVTAEESQNRVVKRFLDLGLDAAQLARLILLRRWPRGWEEVEGVIGRRCPDVIYVDSVTSFLMAVDGEVPQTSETEAWQARMLRFKAWATRNADHTAGVCALRHGTKADGSYAGSVGIGAGCDTIITMRDLTADLGPTYRRLEIIGRWGIPARTVRWVQDGTDKATGETWGHYETATGVDLRPATTGQKISKERKRILDALPPQGAKYAKWFELARAAKSTFDTAIRALRGMSLVTYDDALGVYRRNEFEASQASTGEE